MTESNRLTILAAEIQMIHEDIRAHFQTTARRSVEAGNLLLEARELVIEAGKRWLTWLAENVQISERTAQNYMRLAACVAERTANFADIAEATQPGSPREEEILSAAAEIREHRAAAQRERNERLKAESISALPRGKYCTIVIDPPWDMQKIGRDVRPNQVEFDYPTMTDDELAALQIADLAADDCFLFCWTTQRFWPATQRLIEGWGFENSLFFTWHKHGGFQPLGQPQFNGEYVFLGRRGNPRFVDTKNFFCVFDAPRREHSRKPDEFYNTIRRVTQGPRIDVFSREARDGFVQFGNETDKFGSPG